MNEISQAQYEVIRPYLPVQQGNVRVFNLTMINAVLYMTENGCRWRALPPRFGNWHTIYTRMRRWAEAGDFGPDLADVVAEYLAAQGPGYAPALDGRITVK